VDSRSPDHDASYAVEGIGGSEAPLVLDLSVIDDAERVSDEESFAVTLRLIREEGLLVGGHGGFAGCSKWGKGTSRRDSRGFVGPLSLNSLASRRAARHGTSQVEKFSSHFEK